MLKLKTVVTSLAQSNCYLIMDDETKEGFVIDPGDEAAKIIAAIESMGMKPQAILMTHGHFDHILAADELKERYGIRTYISEDDFEQAKDVKLNRSGFHMEDAKGMEADEKLTDGQVLELCTPVRVIATPGHTPGGVCFYLTDAGAVFTGDTLFRDSVGRTDFPGGSMPRLLSGIFAKLLVLPEETHVYPGHGFPTTIGREKAENPFLRIGR